MQNAINRTEVGCNQAVGAGCRQQPKATEQQLIVRAVGNAVSSVPDAYENLYTYIHSMCLRCCKAICGREVVRRRRWTGHCETWAAAEALAAAIHRCADVWMMPLPPATTNPKPKCHCYQCSMRSPCLVSPQQVLAAQVCGMLSVSGNCFYVMVVALRLIRPVFSLVPCSDCKACSFPLFNTVRRFLPSAPSHIAACAWRYLCSVAQSDPFAMGGLLGALLGQGLQLSGGEEYSNQTPVLSTNNMFDINRRLCI